MLRSNDPSDGTVPTPADIELARQSVPRLRRNKQARLGLRIRGAGRGSTIDLPGPAARLLRSALEEIAAGNAVALVPVERELTTQQAADLLGVSRPFIVAQMDEGRIPFRKVGTHRRVRAQDLMTYRRNLDSARAKTLDELAADAQRLKMGY